MADSSSEIAGWQKQVERLARRFVDQNILCEFDDLVQEGLIGCAISISNGYTPSEKVCVNRMRMWRRKMRAQTRLRAPIGWEDWTLHAPEVRQP